jgi:hypothetical protein
MKCQLRVRAEGTDYLWMCEMCGPSGVCTDPEFALPPVQKLVLGCRRDMGDEQALVIMCYRRPTDDELRAIHDAARAAT